MFDNEMTVILNSGFFDEEYYKETSSQSGDIQYLVQHYIERGELNGFAPSRSFDPTLYAVSNPDLKDAGYKQNLLVHYILYGRSEGRYGNLTDVKRDATIVAASGLFDEVYYQRYASNLRVRSVDSIADQLLFWRLPRRPRETFDDVFYFNTYEDVRQFGRAPFVHFVLKGQYENRPTSQVEYDYCYEVLSEHIDQDFYLSQLPDTNPNTVDPVHDYLSGGWRRSIKPHAAFDPYYYLHHYGDLQAARVDPFLHFVLHGRNEGRVGRPNWAKEFVEGQVEYDATLPTILIANHEASRTGAPLVGLNLAAALTDRFNVIVYLQSGGELESSFLEHATVVVKGWASVLSAEYLIEDLVARYNLDCVILNSAEVGHLARAAGYRNVASISLVHEFAENTLPRGRTADIVRFSDIVVVPSQLVYKSIQDEVYEMLGALAGNVKVRSQGKLDFIPPKDGVAMTSLHIDEFIHQRAPNRGRLILGAGGFGMRKGVDLFVQTAAELNKLRQDCVFIWVGHGYNPNTDISYSVWVAETIKRLGLEEIVHILPAQSNLDNFLKRCDVFYLPSRLDPYPNVVIDALEFGLPIVCFDKATGFAEQMGEQGIHGRVVAYADVVAAAKAINELIGTTDNEGQRNIAFTRSQLDFQQYTGYVAALRDEALASRKQISVQLDQLCNRTELFDRPFNTGGNSNEWGTRSLIDYAVGSSKGLTFANPRPGFSDALFYSAAAAPNGEVALLRADDASSSIPRTHNCVILSDVDLRGQRLSRRCALHVHAHYSDDLEVVIDRLGRYREQIDLFITVTDEEIEQVAKRATRNMRRGKVIVKRVANHGRDIKPLLFDLREELQDRYEIIGHLHLKRSIAIGTESGDRWRRFLLNTLIPAQTGAFKNLLALFNDGEETGLVFAEDRYNVGWGQNRKFADDISRRIGATGELPSRIIFPVGNMFWAHNKVLDPFWKANFTSRDFPVEPVPYDGSMLHAIERMLPSVCEKVGMSWKTVRLEGVER